MKIKYVILFFVFGCTKVEKSKLETEQYKDLVGTWIGNYPNDEERKIIIHNNGKVEIFKSTERGQNFRISEFKYDYNELIKGEDTLKIRMMYSKINGKTDGSITVFKKLYSDTAYFSLGNFYINDFEVDTNAITTNLIYLRN